MRRQHFWSTRKKLGWFQRSDDFRIDLEIIMGSWSFRKLYLPHKPREVDKWSLSFPHEIVICSACPCRIARGQSRAFVFGSISLLFSLLHFLMGTNNVLNDISIYSVLDFLPTRPPLTIKEWESRKSATNIWIFMKSWAFLNFLSKRCSAGDKRLWSLEDQWVNL